MYIPKHFLNTCDNEILSFMQKFSFATLVTSASAKPIATHLPFLVEKEGETITLSSHLAKANPHGSALIDREALVIFSEPHAYISPKYYSKKESVPTWNYISIHAYGKVALIEEDSGKMALLERTILSFEQEYKSQWDELSPEYKTRMLAGITAFSITVTEIQAANKLSQNKSLEERRNIIEGLSESSDLNESAIAEYMKLNLKE